MFEKLKNHQLIFVTGPHRSGTTIAAKMIASDIGHDLVLEDEFRGSNLSQLSAFVQSESGPKVIQCPFLSPVIHDLGFLIDVDMDKSLVVFMHRYLPDIIDSECRASVGPKQVNFAKVARDQAIQYNSDDNAHISDVKYAAWEDQCKIIPNALDVGYESLRDHPMWVKEHKKLPFQHNVFRPQLNPVFQDGIRALHSI